MASPGLLLSPKRYKEYYGISWWALLSEYFVATLMAVEGIVAIVLCVALIAVVAWGVSHHDDVQKRMHDYQPACIRGG